MFYVEPCGTKGLVAAAEDQNEGIKWRGGSTDYNTMARGDSLYAGKMNTSMIIAVHSAKDDFDNHAALVCANYSGSGYGDWYLPSIAELALMYNNIGQGATGDLDNIGGFADANYWSSTEGNAFVAWVFSFNNGLANFSVNKNSNLRVRAVRAF